MASRLVVTVVKLYQVFLSPLHPPTCRFYPSCSAYAHEAFSTLGFWRAAGLTFWRLLRCHPLVPGGWDPVPPSLRRR